MKSIKVTLTIVAMTMLGVSVSPGSANAAGIYCSSAGGNASGLQTTNATFRTIASDDCYGVVLDNISSTGNGGNDGPVEVTSAFSGGVYGTGNFLGVASGGSTVAGTTTFQFSNTGLNSTSGNWTLTATGGLPNTFDIVLALKASDKYALYFFNNEDFTALQSGAPQSGTFTIGFLNGGGQIPGLSGAVAFVRNGTPGGSGGPSGQAVVPEPASLLLLGTGLSAAAWRARRKKANK